MLMRGWPVLGLVGMAVGGPVLPAAAQESMDSGIIAAAVRDRGYECADPVSVNPDPEASAADERAWILHCKDASYRVRFMGSERNTQVEPLS